MAGVLKLARRGINAVLRPAGLELRRAGEWDSDPRGFIPLEATLAEAAAARQSVGDFLDASYNFPGATQEAVDQLAALGAFRGPVETVCEIGPGSGRYLEKVVKICHPARYEIYETAQDWADWLVESYQVLHQPTDGKTLAATPSGSIDLVHAHKVFPSTPTIVTCRYLEEMARVLRAGGKAVFDVMTEPCLDDDTLKQWLATDVHHGAYPAMMPRQYVLDLLGRRGLSLVGSFFVPMKPGRTECFVFAR